MSLSITASTDKVNVGSDASLDDLQTMTSIAWVWLNALTGSRRIWQKGVVALDGTFHNIEFFGSPAKIVYSYDRATADNYVEVPAANFAAFGAGKWLFIAFVSSPTVDADNKFYMGDLTTAAAEPSAYTTRTMGSGAFNSDAAANLILGNKANDATPLTGKIAWIGFWNRQLSPAEIEEQRLWPHITNGCVLLQHLGENDLLTQWDKALSNNGTVTGSAVADDPPLGKPADEGFMMNRPFLGNRPVVMVW